MSEFPEWLERRIGLKNLTFEEACALHRQYGTHLSDEGLMSGFLTPLELEYIDGTQWRVTAAFDYALNDQMTLIVPAGFVTDFASIPQVFWNLLPPTGSYGKAAVLHDYLYRCTIFDRGRCDHWFLQAMEDLGVSWLTRHTLYWGVRTAGWRAFRQARARRASA